METINKNILLIELDDKYLKITAGFQDDEFNFKIIATEVISTNNFENGQIKDLERSVIDLKSGLGIIEKKLNTIFTEAYVITNQKNFDCINVSGFKKMNGNQRPFLWLGNKILPFIKEFGGDIDATWQLNLLEKRLKDNYK